MTGPLQDGSQPIGCEITGIIDDGGLGGAVTSSVPDGCTVTIKTPELSIRKAEDKKKKTDDSADVFCPDFQI